MARNCRHRRRFVSLLTATLAAIAGCQRTPVAHSSSWEAEQAPLDFRKILDSAHGTHRLVVYAYCDSPRLLRRDCVRLNGFSAAVLDRRTGAVLYSMGASEADNDIVIDYSRAADGVYVFTEYTADPRTRDADGVPFVETTVRVDESGRGEKRECLMLTTEPGGPEQITRWRDEAIQHLGDNEECCNALGHIRNLSIGHPREATQAMRDVRPITDGAVAEIWDGYMSEIEIIAKLTGRSRNLADRGH